jgi:hypothetical protein
MDLPNLLTETTDPLTEILEVSVHNVDDDSFGEIVSGGLKIRGKCCNVRSYAVPATFFDGRPAQSEEDFRPLPSRNRFHELRMRFHDFRMSHAQFQTMLNGSYIEA